MSTLPNLALRYLGEYGDESPYDPPEVKEDKYLDQLIESNITEAKRRRRMSESESEALRGLEPPITQAPTQVPITPGDVILRNPVSRVLTGLGETAAAVGTGVVGGTLGLASGASQVLQDYSQQLLSGQTSFDPLPPDYFKNLFARTDALASRFTYAPRTPEGQMFTNAISQALNFIPSKLSQGAKALGLDDDRALALERAAEVALLATAIPSVRAGLRKVKPKLDAFKADPTPEAASDILNDPAVMARNQNIQELKFRLGIQTRIPETATPPNAPPSAPRGPIITPPPSGGPRGPIITPPPEVPPTTPRIEGPVATTPETSGNIVTRLPVPPSNITPFERFQPTIEESRQARSISSLRGRILNPETSTRPTQDLIDLKIAARAEGRNLREGLRSLGFTNQEIANTLPKLYRTRTIFDRQRKPSEEPSPEEPLPEPSAPIPPDPLLTPKELITTKRKLDNLSIEEINEAITLSVDELTRRHQAAMDALIEAQESGLNISQISNAGLQDRVGLYFNLLQRAITRETTSPPIELPLNTPPGGVTIPVEYPTAAVESPPPISPTGREEPGVSTLETTVPGRIESEPNVSRVTPETTVQYTSRVPPSEDIRYFGVNSLDELRSTLNNRTYSAGQRRLSGLADTAAIGYTERPDGTNVAVSIYLDTTGLRIGESLDSIQRQISEGTISEAHGASKLRALKKVSDISGVPMSEAHTVSFDTISRNIMDLAESQGLPVYTKRKDTYEEVPKLESKINSTDTTQPSNATKSEIGQYLNILQSDNLREYGDLVTNGLEQGIDISDALPARLAAEYKRLLDEVRRGIQSNERRSIVDIIGDLNELKSGARTPRGPLSGERGAIGGYVTSERGSVGRYGLTFGQRLAAQRIESDARRANVTVEEYMRGGGVPPVTRELVMAYLATLNNPPPPVGFSAANMNVDPNTGPIVFQRKGSGTSMFPPINRASAELIQTAAEQSHRILPGEPAIYTLNKYGLKALAYRSRDATRGATTEKIELHKNIDSLYKATNAAERRNVTAYMYNLDPDGRRINTANGVIPPATLTLNERRLANIITTLMQSTYKRLNETRAITGKEDLNHVPNYLTLLRKFTIAERYGKSGLFHFDSNDLTRALNGFSTTKFPFTQRTHAKYSAEYDALKILETYMDSAIDYIHISPFTSYLNELVNQTYPNVIKGGDFSLIEANPDLYRALENWKNRILGTTGGPTGDVLLPERTRKMLTDVGTYVTRNVALSSIVLSGSSLLNQLGVLPIALTDIGFSNMIRGLAMTIGDILPFGKNWDFAHKNSRILDTRQMEVAFKSLDDVIRKMTTVNRLGVPLYLEIPTQAGIKAVQSIDLVNQLGARFISWIDQFMATATWHGSYGMHRRAGMSHEMAANLADDTVVRTNGSANRGDLSWLQSTTGRRMIFSLQTYTINQVYNILNDVVGIGSGLSTSRRIWNVIKLLSALTVFGAMYKYVFKQDSPQPDVVNEVRDAIAQGEELNSVVTTGLVEASGLLPSIQGAIRYNRSLGGPAADIARRVAQGDPARLTQLLGVPRTAIELAQGSNVYEATFRGRVREETRRRRRRDQRRQLR